MIIKNITTDKGPKVIGIGQYQIMPGEEKYIPNEALYTDEYNEYGKLTGRKVLLPPIKSLVRLRQIECTEDAKAEPVKLNVPEVIESAPVPETHEDPVVEPVVEENRIDEEEARKKAAAAAKRAATRAANRAAKEAKENTVTVTE